MPRLAAPLAAASFAALVLASGGSPPPGSCAAQRNPDGAAARAWNGIESECRKKLEANRTAAAMRCLEGHFLEAREPGRRAGDFFTTLRKLRHDAEMFTWLEQERLVQPGLKKLYRGIYHSARDKHQQNADRVFEVAFQEQNDDRKLWQNTSNKAVYIDPSGKAAPKRTVRAKAAAFGALEDSFLASGYAVVDNLLTDATLKKVRRFLQTSTFYFYPRRDRHLLALLEDGLASPLLAQLADGLRQALPRVLGPLPLTGARAWKADNSALADGRPQVPDLSNSSADAAVSVLLWTVPGAALNGSAARALAVRPRALQGGGGGGGAGEEEEEPAAAAAGVVKYVANRAVLWGADVEAEWSGPGWKGGFLNRGIHLLLTFGWTRCDA